MSAQETGVGWGGGVGKLEEGTRKEIKESKMEIRLE